MRVKIHIAGRCQHQRTANPEMGKEHLAKALVERLFLLAAAIFQRSVHCQFHILKRESLQLRAPVFPCPQGHKGRRRLHDFNPQFSRHSISVSLGTCRGIRAASHSQDHSVCVHALTRRCLHAGHTADSVRFCHFNALHRAVVTDFHLGTTQMRQQRFGHIRGVVRDRKDSVSPLYFDRAAAVLHKLHHRPGVKPVHSAVKELGVGYHMAPECLYVTCVGQIAAPFSGDIDLLAGFLRLFQNRDRRALFRSRAGSHQSRRAGADHDDPAPFIVFLSHSLLFL